MTQDAWDFSRQMLPRVSRTFAACIRLLGPGLRDEVLVAYLLCRVADTIEDHPGLDAAEKGRLLDRWSACLDEGGPDADPVCQAFPVPADDDQRLAARSGLVLAAFRDCDAPARAAMRPWVQEMCRGMAGFAARQPAPGTLTALADLDELDKYCWYVAGTVGHLLTDLFVVRHGIGPRQAADLRRLATGFGLGLQLVNIIKDVADDRSRGWSFVPRAVCEVHGIRVEDLLDPAKRQSARLVMRILTSKARSHLQEALDYCCTLPRHAYRTRLFCLAPLYFAVRTLALAERDERLLDPDHKVKITRGEVYRTLCMAYVVAPSNHLVRSYHRRLIGLRRG
jgi:farnesyl-diphosphate farnesyltransferase